MRTRSISEEDALQFCARQEDDFFDRKALAIKGNKVQKAAVAFANSDGGELVIGIADSNAEHIMVKRWDGANQIEDFNHHLQALSEIRPSLTFSYEYLSCPNMKGLVLRVTIEKSSCVHQTSDNTVYQRLGAQCVPITDSQRIVELAYAKGASSFEDQLVNSLAPEEVVDTAELLEFLAAYSPRTDPLEFVVNQHLVDNFTWVPRVAGILLFNRNPSSCLPRKCAVKIARYETKEDDPERDHLKSQLTLEGPLYPLINSVVDAVADIMSSIRIWTLEGLRTVQYPPEAVREVIVNAIIHRDYSISDDVHVYIFDNRIEVVSPGRLPAYVTVENILDSRYSRNTKIVRTLNRYPNPPNKDMGEGLNTAFLKMKEWRLKNPEIYEDGNYVKVVLSHSPLARPSEAILDFLQRNAMITNQQARDITGIRSENAVKKEFYKLRDQGLLQRVPGLRGSASAWCLVQNSESDHGTIGQGTLPLE